MIKRLICLFLFTVFLSSCMGQSDTTAVEPPVTISAYVYDEVSDDYPLTHWNQVLYMRLSLSVKQSIYISPAKVAVCVFFPKMKKYSSPWEMVRDYM